MLSLRCDASAPDLTLPEPWTDRRLRSPLFLLLELVLSWAPTWRHIHWRPSRPGIKHIANVMNCYLAFASAAFQTVLHMLHSLRRGAECAFASASR